MFSWPITDTILLLLLAGGVAWALSRLWSRLVGFVWSSGSDPGRRLAHTVAPLRLLLGIAVAAVAITPLRVADEPTAVAELIALALLVGFVGATYLRDILGGLALSIRRPFTVGDQVAVQGVSGRVVELGLTRVVLRTSDGADVDMPNRVLSAERLSTSAPSRRALPIEVTVPLPGGDPGHATEALRAEAYLSAYLDAGAPVICEVMDGRQALVRATPVHPDDADELRSDLTARALTLDTHGPR